jgi:hypothetical protein
VTPSAEVLTNDLIATRCGPQLVKYDALPQFAGATNPWHVAHVAHSYRVGDIVAMLPANQHTYPAYCRIPAVGHESDDVPFVALDPVALTAPERVAMCSESMSITDRTVVLTGTAEPSTDFTTPDLRDAGIFAAASAGKMMVLLLAEGTTSYACYLYPQPWDFGGVRMEAAGDTRALQVGLTGSVAGAAGKSVVPGPATYYRGAGRLPANASTIEFTISNNRVATVSVDANGWWVAAFMVDGRNSLSEPSTYAIKDAAGTVLKSKKIGG